MKFLPRFAALSALVPLVGAAGPAGAASDTFVYEIVSGWTVRTDRARNFACSMEARYEGGSAIRFGYDETGEQMHLLVGDPAWASVEPGRVYSAEVDFGGEGGWTSDASAVVMDEGAGIRGPRFEISPGRAATLMRRLMREYSIRVGFAGRDPIELSLGGSYNAGLKLEECQDSMAEVRDRASPASGSEAGNPALSAGR